MEEVKKEVITYNTIYEAFDGQQFVDKEECKKYEESAVGVILQKLNTCVITEHINSDWFDCGDENNYKTLCPRTQIDIDNLNHLHKLFGGKNNDNLYFTEEDINTIILIGYRFYHNELDWVWFNKVDELISDLTAGKVTQIKL